MGVCFLFYKKTIDIIHKLTHVYLYELILAHVTAVCYDIGSEGDVIMPTICMFRGIKIYINWRDHMPPHFHAKYGDNEVIVSINDIEVIEGSLPNKQLKMLLGWAAFHQEELKENWELAANQQELFAIEPLK